MPQGQPRLLRGGGRARGLAAWGAPSRGASDHSWAFAWPRALLAGVSHTRARVGPVPSSQRESPPRPPATAAARQGPGSCSGPLCSALRGGRFLAGAPGASLVHAQEEPAGTAPASSALHGSRGEVRCLFSLHGRNCSPRAAELGRITSGVRGLGKAAGSCRHVAASEPWSGAGAARASPWSAAPGGTACPCARLFLSTPHVSVGGARP